MTNEQALTTMVASTIVEFHNEYAKQPVKKFSDKETAIRRTCAVLAEAGMAFDEICQLRKAEEVVEPITEPAKAPDPVAESLSDDELDGLDEFGVGVSEKSAECPHCGINHLGNGWQVHGDDHRCSERVFTCLACNGEWGPKIQRRKVESRQPRTDKDVKIAVVGGKDAANPYREGSASHKAFALIQGQPGITRAEFEAAGGRVRTMTHGLKIGQLRMVR